MASKQTLEEITSLALVLLRKEPESDRRRLLNWAENEMEKMGLHPHMTRTDNDTQACHDLIRGNVGLLDLLRLRGYVSLENAMEQETFLELIDLLTPASGDR